MDDSAASLAALFREAGAAHHEAFAATDGDDPDWPRWYAAYLAPRLEALGWSVGTDHLEADLGRVDEAYRATDGSRPWQEFYGEWLLDRLGGRGGP